MNLRILLTPLICIGVYAGSHSQARVHGGGQATNFSVLDVSTAAYSTERTSPQGILAAGPSGSFINASNASNVDGYVKKIGNTAFTMPVGTGADLRTLSIGATTSATNEFTTAWILGNPTTTPDPTDGGAFHSVTALGAGLSSVNTIGQWDWFANNTEAVAVTVSIPLSVTSVPGLRLSGWDATTSKWIAIGTAAPVADLLSGTVPASSNITAIGIGFGGISISLKVLLQGALLGNVAPNVSVMRDNLRNSPFSPGFNYIPSTDPYTAQAGYNTRFTKVGDGLNPSYQTVINPATMFADHANNTNIADWIFIELRDKNNPAIVLGTRSALVQKDGTVVDIDGSTCIKFPSLLADNYFVAVRHRNHLGAMTAAALAPATFACGAVVDFTTMANVDVWNNAGYDGYEMKTLTDGKKALWAGNTANDTLVKFQGSTNDRSQIQTNTITYPGNILFDINYDAGYGYIAGDLNMDSKVKYQGGANDRSLLQTLVLTYGKNTLLDINYALFLQQIPK